MDYLIPPNRLNFEGHGKRVASLTARAYKLIPGPRSIMLPIYLTGFN
jgi:hypothetical protein